MLFCTGCALLCAYLSNFKGLISLASSFSSTFSASPAEAYSDINTNSCECQVLAHCIWQGLFGCTYDESQNDEEDITEIR